ncbi:MAG: DUF6166 domain-containing protein [Campylobacterota bacterium]|nr:DUF6166 domain-containing protein [Campylobacterota bacterium]
MTTRNTHVFKGHKTLLGNRYVTYGEVELPTKYELFSKSKDGFDWGYTGSASIQLSFSMLHQLSDTTFATQNALKFCNDIVKNLNSRDWIINATDVVQWIDQNSTKKMKILKPMRKVKKIKTNVVKDVCIELAITQKNLAEILEVPEGTVSSWAVKNEIPRLGKKAIEFYILNKRNQEVVDSYKKFVNLLHSA